MLVLQHEEEPLWDQSARWLSSFYCTRRREIDRLSYTIVNWINPALVFLIRASACSTRVSMETVIVSCHYYTRLWYVTRCHTQDGGWDILSVQLCKCGIFKILRGLHALESFKDGFEVPYNSTCMVFYVTLYSRPFVLCSYTAGH